MTIIKTTSSGNKTHFRRLEHELVDAISNAWVSTSSYTSASSSNNVLRALECYCDLHGHNLRIADLETTYFQETIGRFLRAFKGSSFYDHGQAYKKSIFRELQSTLAAVYKSANSSNPEWLKNLEWGTIEALDLDESSFDPDLLLYWSSWPIISRKNKTNFLDLCALYNSHGKAFTVEFYSRWKAFFAKQARPNFYEVNYMARFLSENPESWPPSTFRNPIEIMRFFKALLKDYFLKAYSENLNLNSRIKSWNRFASNIDEAFFQPGVWPEPFGTGIPRLSLRSIPGAKTRVSKNENGIEVHTKLLTEVPLQFTDDQAIEVLFSQIDKDLNVVERWAKNQARTLRKNQLRRKYLARKGLPKTLIDYEFIPKNLRDMEFHDICATFEESGFETSQDPIFTEGLFKYLPKKDLAFQLGIPTIDSLFPFQCLLVLYNPKITHTFLSEFDLFNTRGQLSGFIKDGTQHYLTGYKDRRKPKLSEQKILLSARSAAIVRQIIEITDPLRTYLRSKGDDNWRKLFLTSGRGWSHPQAGKVTSWKSTSIASSKKKAAELEEQFASFTSLRGEELYKFLYRISLASIRASKGVQIYLRTKSVQSMSEALGHSKYDGNLLSHYLPESILAFFQTRWIRIFQRAFICEAMKNSPFLMQATDFENIEELHEFLKNHALKDIPSYLSEPETNTKSDSKDQSDSQVLISIDQGILSALLSLSEAVVNSKNQGRISGLAKYWSDFSLLIEKEIIEGNDSLLKQHLNEAKKNLDPKKMEKLIYESAA